MPLARLLTADCDSAGIDGEATRLRALLARAYPLLPVGDLVTEAVGDELGYSLPRKPLSDVRRRSRHGMSGAGGAA